MVERIVVTGASVLIIPGVVLPLDGATVVASDMAAVVAEGDAPVGAVLLGGDCVVLTFTAFVV